MGLGCAPGADYLLNGGVLPIGSLLVCRITSAKLHGVKATAQATCVTCALVSH